MMYKNASNAQKGSILTKTFVKIERCTCQINVMIIETNAGRDALSEEKTILPSTLKPQFLYLCKFNNVLHYPAEKLGAK